MDIVSSIVIDAGAAPGHSLIALIKIKLTIKKKIDYVALKTSISQYIIF